jgi:hypothetical protein
MEKISAVTDSRYNKKGRSHTFTCFASLSGAESRILAPEHQALLDFSGTASRAVPSEANLPLSNIKAASPIKREGSAGHFFRIKKRINFREALQGE